MLANPQNKAHLSEPGFKKNLGLKLSHIMYVISLQLPTINVCDKPNNENPIWGWLVPISGKSGDNLYWVYHRLPTIINTLW